VHAIRHDILAGISWVALSRFSVWGDTLASMNTRPRPAMIIALVIALAACGGDDDPGSDASATTDTTIGTSPAEADHTDSDVVNVWAASSVDPSALPLGDGNLSTTDADVGTVFSCAPANPNAPGAHAVGPWLDESSGTWDSTAKLAVQGDEAWPTAEYTESVDGDVRKITSNGLPVDQVTGSFPIAVDDPAYEFDRNPGSVNAYERSYALPVAPQLTTEPSCLPMEAVGILRNGVVLYNALDGRGDDAAAHEVLDICAGHPSQIAYHYHSVPGCIIDATDGPSTVVGWALDGHPIVVERDAAGNLPSNADLDECHGRTSAIALDGEIIETYHYSATLEYPYTIGCFRGAT
jgi:YHYH protein